MDERVTRLKTSSEAFILAKNAKRLGNPPLEAEALGRAHQLKALEEGFTTPAECAIAVALYAYEDEQSRAKGRKFRASRTRKMLKDHTPRVAAERMVMSSKPSQGFRVLEEAGRQELSFEAIIDRFPEEFAEEAVKAARARLAGEIYIRPRVSRRSARGLAELDEILVRAQREALLRFDGTLNEVESWSSSRGKSLDGIPKKSGIAFKNEGTPHPAKRARNVSMRFDERTALLEWMQVSDEAEAQFFVVTQGGGAVCMPVAGLPYETSAAYASGRLRVVGIYGSTEGQSAIDHYLAVLAEFAPLRQRSSVESDENDIRLTLPSYVTALLEAELDDSERRWLTAHYYAPDATASMEWLANYLGYNSHKTGNLHYGATAAKVGDALAVHAPEGRHRQSMQWVATPGERDAVGHFQWVLRPQVRAALEELGWAEPNAESGAPDLGDTPGDVDEQAKSYGLSDTEVHQMLLSRRGQGRFRRAVLQFWGGCAVSGLRYARLLLASHIKPWRESNPNERLDGFNGLALAPNLDRAFDQGLITFATDGKILISEALSEDARAALGINQAMTLRRIDERIERYLAFHRVHRFRAV